MATMEEAEKIAVSFVKQKRPNHDMFVRSVEQKSDGWTVKGVAFFKEAHGGSTEDWSVAIDGGTVKIYEFKRGAGF